MSFEITGTLTEKYDTQEISSKFKKREFVLEKKETSNGFEFIDYIKFQLTQDKCSIIEPFNIGDAINVSFNLRGRKWEKNGNINYFTNLEAWKLEKLSSTSTASDPSHSDQQIPGNDAPMPDLDDMASSNDETDDLPF